MGNGVSVSFCHVSACAVLFDAAVEPHLTVETTYGLVPDYDGLRTGSQSSGSETPIRPSKWRLTC